MFAGVHVLRALRGGLPHVSAALGAYQLSRVVGNALVVTLGPRRSLLVGAASGVAGYLSLALAAGAPPPQLGATHVAWTGLAWFVASLALVGLSEQITALQDLCRQRHAAEPGGARAPLLKLVSTLGAWRQGWVRSLSLFSWVRILTRTGMPCSPPPPPPSAHPTPHPRPNPPNKTVRLQRVRHFGGFPRQWCRIQLWRPVGGGARGRRV